MRKKQLAIWILCLFLFLIPLDSAAAAVVVQDNNRVYETSFAGTDHSLTGTSFRQEYFQIMDYWNVEKVTVNLHFQISQITADKVSSVTLSLNGTPFYTFRPSLQNNGEQQLAIPAPKELLRNGSNTLTVQGSLRSTADQQLCSVDQSPDQWLHLFNTSSIGVTYSTTALSGGIGGFSSRFTGIDTVRENESVLTVPENSTGVELESAVYALSGFASANTLGDKTIPLLPYRSDTLKNKKAVVLIAMYDHVPNELKPLVSSKEDLAAHAVIQLVNKDAKPTLVITSKDESLLIKAGRLVANRELMQQLSGDLKVVDETTETATPEISINSNVTFTETGDKLTGPYHQEQTYFASLPSNRSIADSSKIRLDFRYAQNLDFDRSLVTVSINETPIGSKKLTRELADGDQLNLAIPQNLNLSGNFTVKVGFDLELAGALCTPNRDQMPWAYIDKDSTMRLNTKDRTDLLLSNYPYPFLRDEIYNHVAVILPQNMDDYTYQSLSNVFNLLGHYTRGNTGDVHFYSDNVDDDHLKNNNIIAIGTYKNNKVIREHNDQLFFKYNSEGTTMESNEKMSIDTGYGAEIGTLQLIRSPFKTGLGLLAVTGVRSENYYLASKLIASEKDKWKVFGDGVLTDKDGNVNAYRFKTITGGEKDSALQEVMDRPDVLGFVVAAVLTLSLVLLSLILLLRKHFKKRGDKRET
ncbi:cellulose biosynthesis cyclic di-GMP-binding regulatory protein BcsB [Paenibacillus sp. BR2-3]|uniref:cellulose biosynthesis cyclic di-GMP-binding regulatory protein BcsB n=1 Tax=Paenibacillus sp. BR2-3 TaxID=3048494 RepID=UPI003977C691